jgi:hypothetical protein
MNIPKPTLARRGFTLAAKFSLALALSACAFGANAEPISAPETAHVRDICRTVMGLSPGEGHFDACVDSLAHTVAGMRDAAHTQAQHEACGAKGLRPGTRDFAVCVVEGA